MNTHPAPAMEPERFAPYAAHECSSRGRHHPEDPPRYRSEFQRDRDRIIHSTAFRRLEYKTQVFVNHEGDLFRTRLTHSLEVAQIARAIARVLRLNEDLTEAIALAHDLGHTPFGHAGQDALNLCMADYGGFEHNLQSLRVVDVLEAHYAEFDGLNLTFETREGILKHCTPTAAPTLGDVGARFLLGHQPSLEAQLNNLADEIAYNNHDVDDGLRSGLITVDQLLEVTLFREAFHEVRTRFPTLSEKRTRHEVIRRMINRLVTDLIDSSRARIIEAAPDSLEAVRLQPRPLICFSPQIREYNLELKRFLRQHLYRHYRVKRMTVKAAGVLTALFQAYMADPALLPTEHEHKAKRLAAESGDTGRARAIADYLAGMTDRFAIAEYGRLFDPNTLS
ncbi:deoxyguanosinetriphosphate triphosphohydrolase [Ectothiorhodospira lacustris]|uniref:deoxyguanosinetriphosphate triphosphohydrolase n=1 Tax=Ectothiorhodospira lacustris TaxID=2899127 RepID=UPI001EE7C23F|nr:deoxyguanosinetriphosphate triphosphohydrolase [Ectothiorhodospira lacustris]MCG5499669.1 deoxyguanosinetriphosphate triphosphohydrolase [Ectothiorhodospira lacustris]MCG5509640.1 deoxyguanosinetriphosphate triphosphohydrolase [Ectothiorhodospira lacustris]MCG5521565.1 deoxyguanosinetriphosphate triphosphohydrolase [Ectothiorhodospira lacustris]